ncbi:MAG: hypothetical protein EPN20_14675, partial [Magnetospirillum sp.]
MNNAGSGSDAQQSLDDLTVLQNIDNQNMGDARLNVARPVDVSDTSLGNLANVQQGSTSNPQVHDVGGITTGVNVALDVAIESGQTGRVAPPALESTPVTVNDEVNVISVNAVGAKPLNVQIQADLAQPDETFKPQELHVGQTAGAPPPAGVVTGAAAPPPPPAEVLKTEDDIITLEQEHVNHAPTMAGEIAVGTTEGARLHGQLAASDADGDAVTFHLSGDGVVTSADGSTETLTTEYGSVTLNIADGTYDFVPATGSHLAVGETAPDSFQVFARDSNGATSNSETVDVTITGTNDAPTVSVNANTTDEDHAVSGQVTGADVDTGVVNGTSFGAADTMTFHLSGDGVVVNANGTETLTTNYGSVTLDTADGTYEFTPATGDHLGVGESIGDSFKVVSTDNNGLSSDAATVDVTITGTNDAPVIDLQHTDTSINVTDKQGGGGHVVATDADTGVVHDAVTGADVTVGAADHLTYSFGTGEDGAPILSVNTPHGTATVNPETGTYAFEPNGEATQLPNGSTVTDHFSVIVSDGQGGSANQTIDVNVSITGTTDHAPVIDLTSNVTATDVSGGTGTVHATDIDTAGGDHVTYSFGHNQDGTPILSVDTSHGSVTINPESGEYTFSPNADATNLPRGTVVTDQFQVIATDSHGMSSDPTAVNVTLTGTTNHGPVVEVTDASGHGTIGGSVSATDADNDTLSYALVGAGADGTLAVDGGVVSLDAHGNYSF